MSQQSGNRAGLGSFFRLNRYIPAMVGTALMAIGINVIYEPLSMVTGGFAGIAIVVRKITEGFYGGIPVWVTTTALNVPLFIWAVKERGISYIKDTLILALSFSFFLSVIPSFPIREFDYLMAAIAGGSISGVGLSLVFSQGMSTGGSDLLSSLLQRKVAYFSVARVLLMIDGMIVLLGIGTFGLKTGLYSIIAVFITTKVMDGILEGLKYAKMVYIISAKEDLISQAVLKEMDRGVTRMNIQGMYSGQKKKMLLCIVSRKEIIALTKIVENFDPDAFVIVTDVREVKGEGFQVRS